MDGSLLIPPAAVSQAAIVGMVTLAVVATIGLCAMYFIAKGMLRVGHTLLIFVLGIGFATAQLNGMIPWSKDEIKTTAREVVLKPYEIGQELKAQEGTTIEFPTLLNLSGWIGLLAAILASVVVLLTGDIRAGFAALVLGTCAGFALFIVGYFT